MNWKTEGKTMKNVLFATTALIATAGMAAAEITFSGGARFGVIYDSGSSATAGGTGSLNAEAADITGGTEGDEATNANLATIVTEIGTRTTAVGTAQDTLNGLVAGDAGYAAAVQAVSDAETALADAEAAHAAAQGSGGTAAVEDSLGITNRFTLNIDGSAETDSGVEYFARVRVRGGNTGDGDTGASGVSAPRVGLSVNGFTFAVGNINGALESTPGLYSGAVGLTGLGWKNLPTNTIGNGYWGWDSFSSSGGGSNGAEIIYSNAGFGAHLSHSPTTEFTALNASYNFGDWTVAGGYQDGGDAAGDTWLLTAGGSFGNFGVGAAYADNDGTAKYRLNGSATFGAGTTVTAFVADEDGSADTTWGLGFTHSLGGATLAGGVVGDEYGENQADLGVRFNF
jgi:outer membrane protein OmpU